MKREEKKDFEREKKKNNKEERTYVPDCTPFLKKE